MREVVADAPNEPAPRPKVLPAPSDPELAVALLRFNTRAKKERAGVKRRSAMPRSQHENWEGLLEALDVFLGRPATQLERLDVIRARVTVEAQLAKDARLFKDFPESLAEAAMERLTLMAVRLSELKRHEASATADSEGQRFAWPVEPVRITSVFGRRRHPITRKVKPHRGVDLDARTGQPIFAAAGGVVVQAGRNGSHGLQVMVEHASGLQTRYSHLSEILVDVGMRLEEGETLGLAGRTGRVTGVHLHFEVWRGKRALDPLEFMRELPEPPNTVTTRS